jgi:hypothetical protein
MHTGVDVDLNVYIFMNHMCVCVCVLHVCARVNVYTPYKDGQNATEGSANSTTQAGVVRVSVGGVRTGEDGQGDLLVVRVPVSSTTKRRIAAQNPSSPRRAAHNNETLCTSHNNESLSQSQASQSSRTSNPSEKARAYSQPRGNAILASLGRDVTRETLARSILASASESSLLPLSSALDAHMVAPLHQVYLYIDNLCVCLCLCLCLCVFVCVCNV